MDKEDKSQHMVIDQTLLTTPKPKACSTNKKERIIRDDLQWKLNIASDTDSTNLSRDSSHVLSLNDVDLTPTLERPRALLRNQDNFNLSTQLKKQRHLAEAVLSGKAGLTSMYLKSMVKSEKKLRKQSESTMNDSDFLSNISATSSFYPNDISTPRSSTASADLSSGSNIAGDISLMVDNLKNTDISIKDLCVQYGSFLKPDVSAINDTFLSSADEAANIILQDEKAWRLQYDTIPQPIHDSVFSNFRDSIVTDEKPSMGEFFKMKSEDCSGIFMKQSPEKDVLPAALISNSTMIDEIQGSSNIYNANNVDKNKSLADYNVSDIVRLLSNESMSKSYLVEYLVHRDCKTKQDSTVPTIEVPESMKKSLSPKLNDSKKEQQQINNTYGKKELVTNQRSHTIGKNISSKSDVSKKMDYTDTFASEKLLTSNTSSCKSSFEDLSDKENTASVRNISPCGNPRCMSPNRSPNRSLTSLRSGSSLDYLIDGRVPIESTKVELVWATVKVGKSSTKDFVLRNKMHQKIRFQIMVTGSCFKIVKPENESQTPISVLLHPLESRSFTVTFTPTAIGAYADRLIFQPVTKTPVQDKPSQKILLYGYGGHISPSIRNLLKDSTGKYWLPLSHIDDISDVITRNFAISNNGSLTAFVDVTITLKYLQVFMGLTITPTMAVIPVGGSQQFQVKYVPNKDDFRRLKYGGQFTSNVCEVVVIKCVFGSEVLRGRIRRLAGKLDGQVNPADALLSRIIKSFSRESIPSDIGMIAESISSLKYLIQNLVSHDIIVTVEQDMDKTLVPNHNDSTSFQTLWSDNINDTTCIKSNTDTFNVYPKTIVLCPKIKHSDVVFLVNGADKTIYYETHLTKDLVHVVPQSGKILPLNTSTIKITYKNDINVCRNECLKLTVSTDNSSCEVDVQIMCLA